MGVNEMTLNNAEEYDILRNSGKRILIAKQEKLSMFIQLVNTMP